MSKRVIHFEIHAENPSAAIVWYRDMFGWRAQEIPGADYWLLFTGDGPGIDGGLGARRGPTAAPSAPVNAFVCTVGTDDLDGDFARALAAGAQQAVAKFAVPNVGWSAYFTDPFGNIVGLHQTDPSAR